MERQSEIYNRIKIIAILLVVLGHCLIMFSPDGAIAVVCGSRLLGKLSGVIYHFHIPCFFMVSGALFCLGYQKGKYRAYGAFCRKKAVRLMVPYAFFGVVLLWPVLLICGLLSPGELFGYFGRLIIGDQVRHLWYLYALFLIFCVFCPFGDWFTKRKQGRILVFSLIVNVVSRVLPFGFLGWFQLGNVLCYQFYFLCGVFLHLNFEEVLAFVCEKKAVPTICFVLLLLSCFINIIAVTDVIYALAGMILVLWFASRLAEKSAVAESSLLTLLNRDAYGVYLFHPLLVYLIYHIFSDVAVFPYFLALIAFALSLILSLALTELFRRAGLGFAIGEGRRKRVDRISPPEKLS